MQPNRALFDLDAEKGLLIGTADYIAPEQAQDATLVDTRADIYSLGCVLFYLLTGRPPFAGPSLMQKLLQHQEEPPPSVQALRPDVPDELNAVLLRMMAKQPEERYPDPAAGGRGPAAVLHGRRRHGRSGGDRGRRGLPAVQFGQSAAAVEQRPHTTVREALRPCRGRRRRPPSAGRPAPAMCRAPPRTRTATRR